MWLLPFELQNCADHTSPQCNSFIALLEIMGIAFCSKITAVKEYRIYLCISRPFTTKKSAPKIALDLYTSHTQRPDQAVQEISITTAGSALEKPVIIVVDFHQFSAHSSSTKKCEIINVKWFKRRPTGDYFYCVF